MKFRASLLQFSCFILLIACYSQIALGQGRYTATPIVLDSSVNIRWALNNRHQLLVNIHQANPPYVTHAGYVDKFGALHDIHSLVDVLWSSAMTMNDRGQIVGILLKTVNGPISIFFYDPKIGMKDLGNPFSADSFVLIGGMNNFGAFVTPGGINDPSMPNGSYEESRCIGCPRPIAMRDIEFVDINDNFQILGYTWGQYGNNNHLYVISPKGVAKEITWDFAPPTGSFDSTYSGQINNRGSVVAAVTREGGSFSAFRDGSTGKIFKIPCFDQSTYNYSGSVGYLNNRDQVVGSCGINQTPVHALIWDKRHGTRDLNSMIVTPDTPIIDEAWVINDRGEILVSHFVNYPFDRNYYLLKPVWGREFDVGMGQDTEEALMIPARNR